MHDPVRDSMIVPAKSRSARRLLNLAQAELARRARLSITALHNIESGASSPRASTLARIGAALEAGRTPQAGDESAPGAHEAAETLPRSLRSDVALLYTVPNARLDLIERHLRDNRPETPPPWPLDPTRPASQKLPPGSARPGADGRTTSTPAEIAPSELIPVTHGRPQLSATTIPFDLGRKTT